MKHFLYAMIALLAAVLMVVPAQCACAADANTGTIAYARGKGAGAEIRLIHPDGSNDHSLWTAPKHSVAGVSGPAWRPDGKEIAFSSDYEMGRSLFESDLYAIRPDGSGLRKITNSPDASDVGRFPKGHVVVKVQNNLRDTSLFDVYVSGASDGKLVTLLAGEYKTLTFDVADFGNDHQHFAVAVHGEARWINPVGVVVHAGQTANAGTISIERYSNEHFGASGPTWSSDGKQVGYILGTGVGVYSCPTNPSTGFSFSRPVMGEKQSFFATVYDFGPPALADQLLYGCGTDSYAIYRTTLHSNKRGEKMVDIDRGSVCGLTVAPGRLRVSVLSRRCLLDDRQYLSA